MRAGAIAQETVGFVDQQQRIFVSRLLKRIDPRGFQVYPARPPTEDEQLRPFLYRFWVRLPARGEIALFDRSWYGRVLIERVAKMVPK